MKYLFGDCFICDDQDIAKKIAFDPRVRLRCAILNGDIYDPAGIVSGGYIHKEDNILRRFKEI